MGYRSKLEAKLARKVTKAITAFDLIDDGDRVMVGLSGGKDSWALMQVLDVLRRRAPFGFSLIAVNVDSGYEQYKHHEISRSCESRGWEYRIEHTQIGEVMDDVLDADATPCSLCAKLRRGVLYRMAAEVGATKIALGHHADDFIEDPAAQLVLCREPQGDAGQAALRRQASRRHSPSGLCWGARGVRLHP